MNQTEMYVDIMRESLERKKGYLIDILDMTKEQEKIAVNKKFDEAAFAEIIDKKQILINNINEADKGFSTVYDRVRSEVLEHQYAYTDKLKDIQQLIRECVDLGMQIETLEQRNKTSLEIAFANSFKGLRKVRQSNKVATQYYKSMSNGQVNDSFLYDRKK